MKTIRVTMLLIIVGLTFSCGGTDYSGNEEDVNPLDVVNTTKLIGTPFEEFTTGDDLNPNLFLCGQYRSETIDSFPILIFTAFFTELQEQVVQEGIDLANEAIGFTAYEITETWSDNTRVIYHVDNLPVSVALGQTYGVEYYFNNKSVAERISTDWAIAVANTSKWLVAHEIGHATGISEHQLIDYENNTLGELETNSLMQQQLPSSPELTDYNFMMSMQGQIMEDHLGQVGDIAEDANCE